MKFVIVLPPLVGGIHSRHTAVQPTSHAQPLKWSWTIIFLNFMFCNTQEVAGMRWASQTSRQMTCMLSTQTINNIYIIRTEHPLIPWRFSYTHSGCSNCDTPRNGVLLYCMLEDGRASEGLNTYRAQCTGHRCCSYRTKRTVIMATSTMFYDHYYISPHFACSYLGAGARPSGGDVSVRSRCTALGPHQHTITSHQTSNAANTNHLKLHAPGDRFTYSIEAAKEISRE